MRKLLASIILITLLLIVVTPNGPQQNTQTICPHHAHATFLIVIDNQAVNYTHYDYNTTWMPDEIHLHQPDTQTIHIHEACITWNLALNILGTVTTNDALALTPEHQGYNPTGVWQNNNPHPLQIWKTTDHYNWIEQNWEEWRKSQIVDGESILITYGTYSEAELQHWQSQINIPQAAKK